MRDLMMTSRIAILAGAALALAACSGGDTAANNATGNELDQNMMLEEPANDASAMEAVGNATEAPAETTNAAEDTMGETDGGDTGGNTVDSNVSGM